MKLEFRPEAEIEIREARSFLNQQSSELGGRFLKALQAVLDKLAAHPESYPKLETLPFSYPYRRAIVKPFHYVVIFEQLERRILVVAVAHTSRRPNYWNYWLGRTV